MRNTVIRDSEPAGRKSDRYATESSVAIAILSKDIKRDFQLGSEQERNRSTCAYAKALVKA